MHASVAWPRGFFLQSEALPCLALQACALREHSVIKKESERFAASSAERRKDKLEPLSWRQTYKHFVRFVPHTDNATSSARFTCELEKSEDQVLQRRFNTSSLPVSLAFWFSRTCTEFYIGLAP